jgi:hypothetical protein
MSLNRAKTYVLGTEEEGNEKPGWRELEEIGD